MQQAKAAGEPFSLAIIDSNMPKMDGFSLVESMREGHAPAETQTIMMTSPSRGDGAGRGRELGVAAQLIKPLKGSTLLNAVVNALDAEAEVEFGQAESAESAQEDRSLRVLLAEDNAVNQRIAKILIEGWGHAGRDREQWQGSG